jgi:hypothetical protein
MNQIVYVIRRIELENWVAMAVIVTNVLMGANTYVQLQRQKYAAIMGGTFRRTAHNVATVITIGTFALSIFLALITLTR